MYLIFDAFPSAKAARRFAREVSKLFTALADEKFFHDKGWEKLKSGITVHLDEPSVAGVTLFPEEYAPPAVSLPYIVVLCRGKLKRDKAAERKVERLAKEHGGRSESDQVGERSCRSYASRDLDHLL